MTCSVGIGLGQVFEDLGVNLKIRVGMDATGGIAMARRQGLGTAKHICTQYLWIQERVRNNDVELRKVLTTETLADLLTKHLAELQMKYLLDNMGFEFPVG